jgi:integrase
MTKNEVEKWRQWKAERPDWPLSVHPRGQWVKRVRGKLRYFGPLDDPDAAAEIWASERDYLVAGLTPPGCVNGLTVHRLLEAHLADVDERTAAGRLAPRTRNDYVGLPATFRAAGLLEAPVSALGPTHWSAVQRVIEQSGRRLRSQANVIMSIRSAFNWAKRMGMIGEINFGPRFTMPDSTAIEAEQDANGAMRFLDREFILAALEAASPKLRVAILLGINCGFYPSDSAMIPIDRLHLDGPIPYHDFRRVKTGRRRMAALWPETVEAVRHYLASGRGRVDSAERTLLLTRQGGVHTRTNGPAALIQSFRRIAVKLGRVVHGVGLGSMRHTYATVVDTVPDQAMIDLSMGHTSKSLQKRIYRQFNLEELKRLRTLSDVVRGWLYESSNQVRNAETERKAGVLNHFPQHREGVSYAQEY